MFQVMWMNSRAQGGLEYLMTYGWALILIAAVIGVLVFIVSSPVSTVSFSSSNPTKIIIKSGAIQDTTATAILQNITGGKIKITAVSATGDSYTPPCTINEQATNINIPAGGTMLLECPLSGEDPKGAVTINYTDFASLQRTAIIRIAGGSGTGGGPPGPSCGDASCDIGEECAADCLTETHCTDTVDNDEDTDTDCDDSDCSADPACVGGITFSQNFGGSGWDDGSSVVSVSDGFVVAGSTDSFGSGDQVYLLKTDLSGNLLWEKNFCGSDNDYGFSVVSVSDGFVVGGYTGSFGSGDQVYLLKTDLDGDLLLWEKNFGGSGSDYGSSVVSVSDGFVVAGYTDSFGSGNQVYLLKTDLSGNQ